MWKFVSEIIKPYSLTGWTHEPDLTRYAQPAPHRFNPPVSDRLLLP
jgi:hypothetical protein